MPAKSSKALLCSKLHWYHEKENSIVAGHGLWMMFSLCNAAMMKLVSTKVAPKISHISL